MGIYLPFADSAEDALLLTATATAMAMGGSDAVRAGSRACTIGRAVMVRDPARDASASGDFA